MAKEKILIKLLSRLVFTDTLLLLRTSKNTRHSYLKRQSSVVNSWIDVTQVYRQINCDGWAWGSDAVGEAELMIMMMLIPVLHLCYLRAGVLMTPVHGCQVTVVRAVILWFAALNCIPRATYFTSRRTCPSRCSHSEMHHQITLSQGWKQPCFFKLFRCRMTPSTAQNTLNWSN